MVEKSLEDFANRLTEVAFAVVTVEKALDALGGQSTFGFNCDPRHLGYQGVDYVEFIRRFGNPIYHVYMKDVYWSETATAASSSGQDHPDAEPCQLLRRIHYLGWDTRKMALLYGLFHVPYRCSGEEESCRVRISCEEGHCML
jgi:hypothetical protein